MILINYQDLLKIRKSLIALTVKLRINQQSVNDYTVQSYIIKKIYKHCLHSFIQTAKSQQNNYLNFETIKLSYYDNVNKSYFEIDVKKNNYYNCKRSDYFVKNCKSLLKNLNYIKINVVKTKKDRALLIILQ